MKKLLITLLLLSLPVFASDKLKVRSLQSFNTVTPDETFKVEVIEDGEMDSIMIFKGDIINCVLDKVVDPSRAKRDAKIYLKVDSYDDRLGNHKVEKNLVAKYADSVIGKDTVKKIPSKNNAKKAAGFIGDHFFKGVSYGISFVDGAIENKDGNRLKSGAKQVYEDSFLSMVEYGKDIVIEKGDEFYLVISPKKKSLFDDENDNENEDKKVENEAQSSNEAE